jgi:NAD(P)-dependent dehydrogenase (short-subunit alcohol dehydrogenase family)
MTERLRDKRVLLIGGETALGRSLAVALAEAGAAVAIASLTRETKAEFAVNSVLNQLWALGREGVALATDASDAAQLREAVESAERGLGRIDVVAVFATEPGAVAVDALGGRPVVTVAPETTVAEALASVVRRL